MKALCCFCSGHVYLGPHFREHRQCSCSYTGNPNPKLYICFVSLWFAAEGVDAFDELSRVALTVRIPLAGATRDRLAGGQNRAALTAKNIDHETRARQDVLRLLA